MDPGPRPRLAALTLGLVAVDVTALSLSLAWLLARARWIPWDDDAPGLPLVVRAAAACVVLGAILAAPVRGPVRRRPRGALALALPGTPVVALACLTAAEGDASATHFSPDRFELRRVYRWQVPILELPLFVVRESYRESSLAPYLAERGLIRRPPRERATWHLVSSLDFDGHRAGFAQGFAGNVCFEPLGTWAAWSRAHPDHAADLWPKVTAAALARDYATAGDLIGDIPSWSP